MLDNLKADYELCKVAMAKHLRQKKWYRGMLTLDKWLQRIVATGIFAGILLLYYKYLFPRLGWRPTAVIALSLSVSVLCWAIRAVRYFHEDTVSSLQSQHEKATGLFHRNADIIARLNYAKGRADQMVLSAGGHADQLDDEKVLDWAKGIVDYLKEYGLHDLIARFSADDVTLLKALPESIPSDPGVLRRERFNARRNLLVEFTRELRNQAINSPFGSGSGSSPAPPDRTLVSDSTRSLTE